MSIPKQFIRDTEEHALVEEIASDIAFGLYTIDREEKQSQTEEALSESETNLSQIIQTNPIPTFVINNKHIITHWNRACEDLTGISCDQMIGTQNQWKGFYSEKRQVLSDFIIDNAKYEEIEEYYEGKSKKSDKREDGYEVENFFPSLGEKGKWLFLTAAPLKDTNGKVIGAIETLQDVTQRKKTQALLQKSMQSLNERVKELNYLYSISRLVETQDISLEEIFQGAIDLIPQAWQYPEITCARIILDGQEFKTSNFKKTIWCQAGNIIVYSAPKGTLEICYLKERPENEEGPFTKEERALLNAICQRLGRITERKWTSDALIKSERRFRDLIEYSPIGICIIQDDQIVYQNPEQEKLLGPLPRISKLLDYENIHPDDVVKVKEFYQNLNSNEVQSQETEFRFYPEDENGNRLDMKWSYCRASPIEYHGRKAILVNMMDVTRAKELENILRIQDKMSSLGRVAVGIAHEIRNPLSGINIYLNTMEKMYDRGERPERLKQIFKQLQSASNKIESVIRRVMDFSRPSEPHFVSTDINHPIEEAIDLSSVTLRKRGIKLEKALSGDIPLCKADPQLIEQVLLNLITNATEAMKNVEGEKRIGVTSFMENDCITVRVIDSGSGVPFHVKEIIFDPFYTTKNGSTGIGLSLCRRIISDHGGFLNVYQSEWGGAEFRIEIPLAKGTT
ncbi:PAS domain S-box protein [Thermodesulfobacteriota bacterium]